MSLHFIFGIYSKNMLSYIQYVNKRNQKGNNPLKFTIGWKEIHWVVQLINVQIDFEISRGLPVKIITSTSIIIIINHKNLSLKFYDMFGLKENWAGLWPKAGLFSRGFLMLIDASASSLVSRADMLTRKEFRAPEPPCNIPFAFLNASFRLLCSLTNHQQ